MDEHVKDLFCCGHGVLLGLRSLKMLNASYNELTHLHGLSGCTELQQLVGFYMGFHNMYMGCCYATIDWCSGSGSDNLH